MSKTLSAVIGYRLLQSRRTLTKIWNTPIDTPTRHFFVDDLLPPDVAAAIYNAFPTRGEGFTRQNSMRERKSTSKNLCVLPGVLTDITYAFQDPLVIEAIADITGMKWLEPDPKLYAGGLSMMFRGDFLNPHIDNSHNVSRTRYRRLNLLYYCSPGWTLEHGGNFSLWDEGVRKPSVIVSRFNRLLVMETNNTSWHSVFPVLVDSPRCCVSNYYFSPQSPDGSDYYHVTSFTGRPDQPVLRLVGVLDNAARNLAGRIGFGRGRKLINHPSAPPG